MTKSVDQPRRGDATRVSILDAAMTLAAERGWDAVSTRQIADRAGVNQALIHYHFGSKDALFEAAFEMALRDMFQGPMQALVRAPDMATGAAELVRAFRDIDDTGPEMSFSMEAMSRAARDETIRRSMAAVLAELRTVVADRIRVAQRTGELRDDLDPEGTATALGGLFDGLGLHLLIDRDIDVDRTADAVATLLRAAAGRGKDETWTTNP